MPLWEAAIVGPPACPYPRMTPKWSLAWGAFQWVVKGQGTDAGGTKHQADRWAERGLGAPLVPPHSLGLLVFNFENSGPQGD